MNSLSVAVHFVNVRKQFLNSLFLICCSLLYRTKCELYGKNFFSIVLQSENLYTAYLSTLTMLFVCTSTESQDNIAQVRVTLPSDSRNYCLIAYHNILNKNKKHMRVTLHM